MLRNALPLVFMILALSSSAQETLPQVADDATESQKSRKPDEPTRVEETIVVSATRSERGISELPVSATVVDEQDLETAPALYPDDLIRTIPGVHLQLGSTAGTLQSGQRISMRGLGGTRALVLVDGVPLHDPFYGTPTWQKVPVETIQQVEVVRGGAASLFGSSALGGTINMVTRPVGDSFVAADLTHGSADTARRGLSLDYRFNELLGLRVSQQTYETAGFIRVPFPGPIDRPGWNDSTVSALRLDYTPGDSTRAYLKANLSDTIFSEGNLAWNDRDSVDFAAGMQRILGNSSLLAFTAFTQRGHEYRVSSSVSANRDSQYISNISTIPAIATGGSADWSFQRTGRIAFFSMGLDVQRLDAEEDRTAINRTGTITQRVLVEGHQKFAGVFAQMSWRPTAAIEVLTSARLDHYSNDRGREQIVGGAASVYPSSSSTQLDPRVSLRFAASDRLALRGAAYRAFKAPSLRDLYRSTITGNSVILANPDLEPETLIGGELGVDWALPRAVLAATLYWNEVSGIQARSQVPGQPANVFMPMNLGSSRSQGVEASASLRVTRQLSAELGYTYADSTVIEDPDPKLVGKLLPEVVPHIGTLTLRYRTDRGTAVETRYRVLSRSYGEATNAVAAPAHRVLDISASHPLNDWLDAYALLENALDEHYYYVLTPQAFRNAQPRTLNAGFRARISFSRSGR